MTALRFHGDRLASPGQLDFAVNVWPAPRPGGLERALEKALRGTSYPDERPAQAVLARRFGRPEEEVLLVNGSCELFWLLAALRPRHAVSVHPSFTEPEAALRAGGVRVTRVVRRPPEWALRPGEVPEDADLVVVGNPNNPTGTLDPAACVATLAAPGRTLVVDEAFMDFVPEQRESLARRRDVPGLVVVRSLTKLWSLAGIRAGFVLAPGPLVASMQRVRQPWSVNALACAALEWCAHDDETPARVARDVAEARGVLIVGLQRLGLSPLPSVANFVLVALPPHTSAALAERGIVVRPAASFPGLDESYARIAVRPVADTEVLLAALEEVLDAA